jgi:hypothetical protein
MSSEDSEPYICDSVFVSPGWRIPMDWEHSIRFRHYSGKFKATNDRVRPTWVSCVLKSAQWHLEWCKPTCPHFVFVPCSSLDLSLLLLVLEPYLQAGWLKWVVITPMSLMHLDSADKQAISRGKRGRGPQRTELLFSPSAERGGEKRFVMHSGVALHDFRAEFFSASGCSLLESFHLCHVPTCCLECMHEARLCIQASDCLHSGYIQSPMMQFNLRGERWSRLHCAYRMKCQAPSFSWCHRRGSMWMWDLSHMSIWIQKQSLLCWFSITKKVPSAFVCVCACVCVWDVLSWFASALQVLIWFQGLSTSPFLWEEVCVCALCKVYHIQWFTKRYMFWRSACQHIWIIVMCSIRDNCVSFMFALSVSIPIGSLMFHMHYSAFVKGVWLYVSACIGTMHVHARIESLHVYARIPSFSCFCMCLLISKADQVSAFVCSYWEICVYLHSLAYTESWAFVCMWLESWAFVGMFQELSVYLHSVPCVESCACVVCMCLVC